MRQKNLGRKKSRLDRSQPGGEFSQIEHAIWEQEAPDGFCEDPYCRQCDEHKDYIESLIFKVKENISTYDHRNVPDEVRERIYQEAYNDAVHYLTGEHRNQLALVGAQEFERGRVTMQQNIQRLQDDSYQRGYQAGRFSMQPPPQADQKKLRQDMVDEMLDQCKIIAESNPNMKPGVNAVRHRIKKLKG